MSHIGAPLLGDWLYGFEDKELFPRQALHSCYLKLTHPITGETLEFFDDLPEDMQNFLEKFR
jgi:23S rRNA pseudouridine1911/1915/1917 synthase